MPTFDIYFDASEPPVHFEFLLEKCQDSQRTFKVPICAKKEREREGDLVELRMNPDCRGMNPDCSAAERWRSALSNGPKKKDFAICAEQKPQNR